MSADPGGTAVPHAVVVGGGIGGLTAAVALHRRGWRVTVLERARSLEPVGAGIALAPNGQRALDVIGLGDAIRAMASWEGDGGLRSPSGRWLARSDAAVAAEHFGGPVVLLHRADLVERLAALLPPGALRTGAAATLADAGDPAGRPALIRTAAGELTADLAVAADGIHSATRAALFPGHPGPTYSGFTSWRMVVPGPGRPFAPHETWGAGALWGTQPLPDGRVYAYAAALAPPGGRALYPDGEKGELLRRFGGWHDPIPALLRLAEPGQVLRTDLHHLLQPLPALHFGRTALLGDAAHAMTPFLGQGGNQAVEDAVVLAHRAAPGREVAAALSAYTADRLDRTASVVRRSARAGRAVAVHRRPMVALRDLSVAALARLAPTLPLRALAPVTSWHPPAD